MMRGIHLSLFFFYLWGIFTTAMFSQNRTLWREPVDALVVTDENEFEVINEKKAVYRVHRLIHVYKPKGDKYAALAVSEDKFSTCKDISATIWSMNGRDLKKFKKKDFDVIKFSPGGTLYIEDAQTRGADLSWNKHPYKVEYQYEIQYNSLFFWQDWLPQLDIPVLKSSYRLILRDENIKFNEHFLGDSIAVQERRTNKGKEFYWELTNLGPADEDSWIAFNENVGILFTPIEFTLGDYRGRFDSWDNIARWYAHLAKDQYQVPPTVKGLVEELTAGIADEKGKAEALYYFLQKYTRYVAIYLGIGGWQPHPASTVYQKKYGDCKDLTTLMIALLHEAGIKAYPALTPTRDYRLLIDDFPSNQFNHCITCVPLQNDTLWLECTADYLAAGDLPPSVEGAKVLVVGDNGGHIVQTPISAPSENLWKSVVHGSLSSLGALSFTGSIRTTGNQAFWMRGRLIRLKREKRDNWVHRLVGKHAASVNIQYRVVNLDTNYQQPLELDFEGTANKLAKVSSRRLFLVPAMLNGFSSHSVPDEETRKTPLYFRYAYTDIDSVIIHIPLRYSLEAAPNPLYLQTDFAEYRMDYTFRESELTYSRYYRLKKIEIPPEAYPAYRAFLKQVSKTDQATFVFKR